MKTAGRILGTAFFREGYQVQDAPRYGAERRGAPIFAYVRAAREPIYERGVIRAPDLVVVADDTLVGAPAAGVQGGVGANCVLLIQSAASDGVWRERLGLEGPVVTLPPAGGVTPELSFSSAACAGAAARLVGVISRGALEHAIRGELETMSSQVVEQNLEQALAAYDGLEAHAGLVREGGVREPRAPSGASWVELAFEPARISAPDVHASATSVEVQTGLWRTMRPVIDLQHCRRCTWVCGTLCPDAAIHVDADGAPQIDYDHCKGCLVCVAVCPSHAIAAIPERHAESEGR
jgi:pyruvate ferredoxin oxidoreductase gamma subunit